jgi:aspartate aminotransferase
MVRRGICPLPAHGDQFMADLNPNVLNCSVEDFRALRSAAADPNFIMLAIADPYRGPAAHVVEAYRDAAGRVVRYGPLLGDRELRTAIAAKLQKENGIEADVDTEIMVTHGAGHGFLVSLMSLIRPGDEVLTPDPSFPLNWGSTQLLGATPIGCRINGPGGVGALPRNLAAAISPCTRAIILHNPNNPTGDVLPREVLQEIAELAQKHDLFVLSDEVYERFIYDGDRSPSIASLPGMKDRTITLFGFSKDHAISGLRVGYLASSARIVAAITRVVQNDGVGANGAGQRAALAALTGAQDHIDHLRGELSTLRHEVVRRINAMPGLKCALPAGGYFCLVDARAYGDSQVLYERIMTEAAVGVSPGDWYGPGGAGHFRICYAAAERSRVIEALDRLAQFFATAPTSRTMVPISL